MGRKKKHEAHHEEHIDETWLIPYADLLTLLLALFIVLFASAEVDQKKFDHMAYAMNMAFSGSPSVFDKNTAMVDQSQAGNPQMSSEENRQQQQLQETIQLLEAKKAVDRYIQDNKLSGDLSTIMTEDGLMIRIKDSALFNSGSADLLPESRRLTEQVAKMLLVVPQKVVISGHTDNVPINTREFPSNWELSSKRAINFMKQLMVQENLRPERFSAIGHSEYKPVGPNETEEGRQQNRRVDVLIMRNYR